MLRKDKKRYRLVEIDRDRQRDRLRDRKRDGWMHGWMHGLMDSYCRYYLDRRVFGLNYRQTSDHVGRCRQVKIDRNEQSVGCLLDGRSLDVYVYIYIYVDLPVCVCACVCVCKFLKTTSSIFTHIHTQDCCSPYLSRAGARSTSVFF